MQEAANLPRSSVNLGTLRERERERERNGEILQRGVSNRRDLVSSPGVSNSASGPSSHYNITESVRELEKHISTTNLLDPAVL